MIGYSRKLLLWVIPAGLLIVTYFLLAWLGGVDSGAVGPSPSGQREPPQIQKPGMANRDAPRSRGGEIAITAEESPGGIHTLPDIIRQAETLNDPETVAEDDIEKIQYLLRVFRRVNNGCNPQDGSNEEIVKQLLGANVKRFAVLSPTLPAMSPNGELMDRWGTPYWFHTVSETKLEIRSAGPDGRLFTNDDIAPQLDEYGP